MIQNQLVQTMKEKAEAVQAIVSFMDTKEEAFRYAVELTRNQAGKTLAAPGWENEDSLQSLCETQGVTFLKSPLRNDLNGIHTGLTAADWGIAETGTLVIASASENIRIATMLAETHVAILPKSKIFPDSVALEAELKKLQKSPPSYVAFITGASRTADIERVLTIGVHGPQELHIIITEASS